MAWTKGKDVMMAPNNSQGSCGCGRTADPNGNCDGSHGLSPTDWLRVKSDRELRAYQQQAQELWFAGGSCTGGNGEI